MSLPWPWVLPGTSSHISVTPKEPAASDRETDTSLDVTSDFRGSLDRLEPEADHGEHAFVVTSV